MTAPSVCRALMTELVLPDVVAISSVTVDEPLAIALLSNSRSCLPIWDFLADAAGAADATVGTATPAATIAPRAVRATAARRTLGGRKICMRLPSIEGADLERDAAPFIHRKFSRSRHCEKYLSMPALEW